MRNSSCLKVFTSNDQYLECICNVCKNHNRILAKHHAILTNMPDASNGNLTKLDSQYT